MTNQEMTLTDNEAKVLNLCLNYDDRGSQICDNYSNGDLKDAQRVAGGKHEGAGLIGSLVKKGLIDDPASDEQQIIWLTELGVNTIFDHNESL